MSHGSGPFTAALIAFGDRRLESVAVADGRRARSGSRGSGVGRQVEEVEGAVRRLGEVGGDRRDDAAGRAGDQDDRLGVQHQAASPPLSVGVSAGNGCTVNADAEPQAVDEADLDAARIAQCLVDQLVGEGVVLRLAGKSTAFTSASGRSSR